MEKRRNFNPEEKAKIMIDVLREEKTLNEIAAEHEIHPNQISHWKAEFLRNAGRAFSKETDEVEKVKQSFNKEKNELLNQIGQLSYEVNWLFKKSCRILIPSRPYRYDRKVKQKVVYL